MDIDLFLLHLLVVNWNSVLISPVPSSFAALLVNVYSVPGCRPVTGIFINSPWMKFPLLSILSISWEPSVTFTSTISIGAVPMSDTWTWTVRESKDLEKRRMEGGPGKTVHAWEGEREKERESEREGGCITYYATSQ